MKNIKRKEEGVSPVIATILMVAITVVLAATLYMMLPSGNETDTTEAMSGRLSTVSDGWIIQIDSGSVTDSSDKYVMYNTSSGVSYSGSGDIDVTGDDTDDVSITFNDNDNNGDINGGDTFKITNSHGTAFKNVLEDNYQFRVKDTSLQVNLG